MSNAMTSNVSTTSCSRRLRRCRSTGSAAAPTPYSSSATVIALTATKSANRHEP